MKLIDLKKAKDLLLSGEVVAIPTETVYGLGGWIHSDSGLKKIFSTKERPFFDPLIVHVSSIEAARALSSDWTPVHEALAQFAWPGPLTLVTKKNDLVSPLITSGLDSVAVRIPNHPVTLELLKALDGGVAAPSANKFGKTSPTTSVHVVEEFNDEVCILEGGPCEIGIESTVAGVTITKDGPVVEIYRPGFFTSSMLREALKRKGIEAQVLYAESPVAPGQLKHHYMPKIPLVIVPQGFFWDRDKEKIESVLNKKFQSPVNWVQSPDAFLASRNLYQSLRQFDQDGYDIILTSREPHHSQEEWLGVWNRLSKAKTLELLDEKA